jgi:calcium-translocating P-type ATPase
MAEPRTVFALAARPPAERLAALGSSPAGLDEDEARRRLLEHGPNEPIPPERRHPLAAFSANFTHTLALLLWFAAGLAFAGGVPHLGGAIVAVIAVNGLFAWVQEYRAARVVGALMRRIALHARVVRGGAEHRVAGAALVPGDVIRIAAGDLVPADSLLLAADNLALDLSMITGESLPVARTPEPASAAVAHPFELPSFAPAGAGVVTGSAEALVWATGPESTLGSIAALVEGVRRGSSVLERQVSALSRLTAVLAVLAGMVTLLLATATADVGFVAALTFSTGVIVALVPEGLLPTLSVSLAIGAERMARRGAAVRRLSSVEAIGAATVICTDKTGTLTENSLSVLGFALAGPTAALEDALRVAALCSDVRTDDGGFEGDPIDVALARWARAQGFDVARARSSCARVADVPFDARRRYMSVTCRADGLEREYVKGAPEAVAALCGEGEPVPALAQAVEEATARGERVLMLATRAEGASMRPVGIVRLYDPPRSEVPRAIEACHRARIRIVMLTGDYAGTARAVADALGIAAPEVIDGEAVDTMSDAALVAAMRDDAVFARIDPRQKLRLTTLLRRAGDVVGVTGDGITAAPALRAADVGVAMGRRGTEVAKQAADIVLADDNFATLVAGIEEGRSIKANIRRFVSYVFTSNVAELAPFLVYIFLPVPLPLTVAQVLAIDLGTDILPALGLGTERPSAATMDAAPEPAGRPILTRGLAFRTFLFYGAIEAALGIAAFFGVFAARGWRPFDSLDPYATYVRDARALTFLGIVSGQIGCLFAQRDGPLLQRLSLRSNAWITFGLATEVLLAVGLVYVPGVNRLFSMAPVNPAWLLVLPAGAAIFLLLDLARRALARAARR